MGIYPLSKPNAVVITDQDGIPVAAGSGTGSEVQVTNFPATQPVSGVVQVSNFPATQPVSAASLPLPSGAATSAKQPAPGTAGVPSTDILSIQGAPSMTPVKTDGSGVTQPISGSVAVSNLPATQPVSGAVSVSNLPATQPVSGAVSVSNFPATQPVSVATLPLPSGAATSAKQPALGTSGTPSTDVLTIQGAASMTPVKTDGSGVTQPVSGSVAVSNFPATQPVSAASLPLPSGAATSAKQPALGTSGIPSTDVLTIQGAASMTPIKTDGSATTQPVSGSVNAVQPTAANLNATVVGTALTKGTQGAAGFSVQELKDAGRVIKSYSASAVAGVTAEALITLTPYADLVAGSPGTSFTVTAGKRLRIQAIKVTWRNNTAAAGGVTIRLRTNAGTVLVTSPVQGSMNATTSLATIGSGAADQMTFPDGLELSGTMQFGLTQLAVGAVVGFDVHVIGYEY